MLFTTSAFSFFVIFITKEPEILLSKKIMMVLHEQALRYSHAF